MKLNAKVFNRWVKPAIFFVLLLPLILLLIGVYQDSLGANPIEVLTRESGEWTLILLVMTLSLSTFKRLLDWPQLTRLRRMFGLFVFFYASLHLLTYLWLDKFFEWQAIVLDFFERPFITAGMLGYVFLIPLAVTSTQYFIKRLAANWIKLHRLIYLVFILCLIHFWWLVKADTSEPLLYTLLFLALLLERAFNIYKKNILSSKI